MRAEFSGAGYISRKTPAGHRHLLLDFWSVPTRTPEWAAHMKKQMGERQFNREFRRDWESTAGDPYYPEWQTVEKEKRVISSSGIVRGLPILRFWDCGFRYPGCLWAQYSQEQNRLWILRELMPSDIDAHSFIFLVLFLSGQIEQETFNLEAPPMAFRWLEKLQREEKYPPPPWFSSEGVPPQFLDFAGPEATQVKDAITSENEDRTYAEIMSSMGIQLQTRFVRHKARSTVLRSLMRPRPDGYFGLVVDPACDILIRGLNGGIAYEVPGKDEMASDECVKDGYFEHLHDALGYGVVQVCKAVQPGQAKTSFQYARGGRKLTEVTEMAGEESLGFSEVEDGVEW